MPDRKLAVTAAGIAALATPLSAQDFYVGTSLSTGAFTAVNAGGFTADGTGTIQSVDVMGGVRFDVGSGYFWGAEVQGSQGNGYPTSEPYLNDSNRVTQAEIHFGRTVGGTKVFGFLGSGQSNFADPATITSAGNPSVFGVGAEISISDRAAVRLEAEILQMSIEDACCGTYDPVRQQDLSAGIIFNF